MSSQETRRLSPDVEAPREARAFVASHCPDLSSERLDVVRLLTSELVNNAMWHAKPGPVWLDLKVDPDRVTVGVTDGGGGTVGFAPDYLWPESGHGLKLVDALSTRWGIGPDVAPLAKRVWFEVSSTERRGVDACSLPGAG